jgi:hypothetical protein
VGAGVIDWPDQPTVGQHCFSGGASFEWTGVKWKRASYVSVPSATLTSLVPNTGIQGAAAVSTRILGSGFLADSVVQVDGVTVTSTFVSATELTASISSPTRGGPTSRSVRVLNTDITGTFPSNTLPITYDGPRITSVSPNVATMNEAVALTVRGSNFISGDQIVVNGVASPATFVSATELQATVTPPYFPWTIEPPPPVPCPINIAPTLSSNQTITLTEPRFKIRSTYPDYYSEWTPNVNHIEVWGWGMMGNDSVVYFDNAPKTTWVDPNAVGTELILVFDINPPPETDKYCEIKVLNKSIHWSVNSWSFWVEDIG